MPLYTLPVKPRKNVAPKKARGNIEKLLPFQRQAIQRWFHEKLTYRAMVTRIYGAFGLKLSITTIGNYYRRYFVDGQLREMAAATAIEATGVEVIILFPEPGSLHVNVRPLRD